MASSTQCTWVWANSGRYWRTGKPGVLQSMMSQRVGHDLVTEQHWEYVLLEYHIILSRIDFSVFPFSIFSILASLLFYKFLEGRDFAVSLLVYPSPQHRALHIRHSWVCKRSRRSWLVFMGVHAHCDPTINKYVQSPLGTKEIATTKKLRVHNES